MLFSSQERCLFCVNIIYCNLIDVNNLYDLTLLFLIPQFVLPDINVILNTKYLYKCIINVILFWFPKYFLFHKKYIIKTLSSVKSDCQVSLNRFFLYFPTGVTRSTRGFCCICFGEMFWGTAHWQWLLRYILPFVLKPSSLKCMVFINFEKQCSLSNLWKFTWKCHWRSYGFFEPTTLMEFILWIIIDITWSNPKKTHMRKFQH